MLSPSRSKTLARSRASRSHISPSSAALASVPRLKRMPLDGDTTSDGLRGASKLRGSIATASEVAPSRPLQPRLYVAGSNSYGECLGRSSDPVARPTLAPLDAALARCEAVALGKHMTLLLREDGGCSKRPGDVWGDQIYARGRDNEGRLGRGLDARGKVRQQGQTLRVQGLLPRIRITHIAVGGAHCAAVTECGQLRIWGSNSSGQCGLVPAAPGHRPLGSVPSNVPLAGQLRVAGHCNAGALAKEEVSFVACGLKHTVALTRGGGVIAFGCNAYGQLGTGDCTAAHTSHIPTALSCEALRGMCIVGCAASERFTHLVSSDGRVFAMGDNERGQLGLARTNSAATPTVQL